jgi:Tfp pilus assembly protein PilO
MSRRVLALLLVFFVAASAAWWFFLISPRNARVGDLDNQLSNAVAEEEALRRAVVALQEVQQNDVAFLAAIGQMEAGIPMEAELAVFIEEVIALARRTGIELQSIAPSEPVQVPDLALYEITVTMALRGEYFEMLDFLFRLDDMERIAVVQAISISAASGAGPVEQPVEPPEETTTTTVVDTTTTTGAGETTTTTTTTSPTTTTVLPPALQRNVLSVSLTLKLYTRSPLLPVDVLRAQTGVPGGGEPPDGEALSGGGEP